jgi:ATP-binding cassette subfamily B protein RaxB
MIATHFGASTDLTSLRQRHNTSLQGATLDDLIKVCRQQRLSTRAIRCEAHELEQLRTPCILHWRFNHFVVLKSVSARGLEIHDPARGVVREPLSIVNDAFTGVALEVTPSPSFQRGKPPLRLRLRNLWTADSGLNRKFAAGLLLALICEALLLTSPFYLQLIIDQVLGRGDNDLLLSIVVAFATLLGIQVIANVMRQLTFNYLGYVTVFDITTRVLQRLLRSPIHYFRSRDLGDIQYRMQSLGRIQSFIVHSVPAIVLDAVFLVLIFVLMSLYDPLLTACVVALLIVWCIWRLLILPARLRLASDIAQAESAVQTHMLETLRSMQSIKVGNGESQREADWRNLFADATNARIRSSNLAVVDTVLRQLLFNGARIAIIYQLARKGLDGRISIGMISAYVAYLAMFTTRACGIVDRLFEYKLLDVPLNRLADIVFSEEEPGAATGPVRSIGDIQLRNVSFSFAKEGQPVLKDCSMTARQGSFTAIAGSSGSGKSTLLQLIARNETDIEGELVIGGYGASRWQVTDLRSQMAVVMQGDTLLKGSITENIALFDTHADRSQVVDAAVAACIADEIEAFPMAYETRIGDLGSLLSRGQVQRLLLARAFYRRPALLLLDEATSGLDHDLEKRVIQSIQRLPATRIVVTHSDLMLQAADSVLWLHEGRLLLSRPDLNV